MSADCELEGHLLVEQNMTLNADDAVFNEEMFYRQSVVTLLVGTLR